MITGKKNKLFLFNSSIVFIALLSSCTQLDTFEKDTSIPKYEWKSSFEVKGSFSITDTTSRYIASIVIRHTDNYKYNNLWLNVGIQYPGDTMFYQKVNVELVKNDEKGWEGTGMNDIWEIRQLLSNKPVEFKKTGTYNFTITQIMRDDPLPAVMSAGLRLEKK
jgi:gliding motility-associated lipoprotein GldH